MKGIIFRRTLTALATVFVIITISFLFVHFMPGDPLVHLVGQEDYYYLLDASPETLEQIARKYGLSDPLGVQYLKYLRSIVTLDFGQSHVDHRPVLANVTGAAKWTLLLSVPTLLLGGLLGGALGTAAGWRPGRAFDKISTPVALVINTIPSNCLGMLLLIAFAYKLRIFPINGMVSPGKVGLGWTLSVLRHMVLPISVLVLSRTAGNFMLMKSAVSQVRHEEYTVTATSKGLSSRAVLFRHVLRNAMLPYMTSLFLQMGGILSGAMVVEVVFGWKGMGMLMYNAVQSRDFPTAQLCFLISAVLVVSTTLLSDVMNAALDPRIKEAAVHD